MKKSSLYAFGKDGSLWTHLGEGFRRPSTVEEREGFCRLLMAPIVRMTPKSEARIEGVPVPLPNDVQGAVTA
ncbi:MAG: hypothetical protein HQ475_10300 [SAR202 cluster bacterium]|nr:hypothetical protein [SAR202 cluster bacterium]